MTSPPATHGRKLRSVLPTIPIPIHNRRATASSTIAVPASRHAVLLANGRVAWSRGTIRICQATTADLAERLTA